MTALRTNAPKSGIEAPPVYRPQPFIQPKLQAPPVYRPNSQPIRATGVQRMGAGQAPPAVYKPAFGVASSHVRGSSGPPSERHAPQPPQVRGRTIQRKKEDAEAYIRLHALGIAATYTDVVAYTGNTGNPGVHRVGLADAWNLGQTGRWMVEVPVIGTAPTPMALDTYFSPGTPMYGDVNAPPSPTPDEYYTLGRRNSGEFSSQFNTAYGSTISDFRDNRYSLEHNHYHSRATLNNVSSGFVSLTGKQKGLWEGTVYGSMFPNTQAVLGKDDNELAQLVLYGLLDDAAYQNIMSTMTQDQQIAMNQLLLLFHNEILKRGSNNLIAIVQAAYRTIHTGDNRFTDRLEERGLFFPTAKDHKSKMGGGVLSSLHHDQTTWNSKTPESDLIEIMHSFRKTLAAVSQDINDKGLTDQIDILIGKYINNLKNNYSLIF